MDKMPESALPYIIGWAVAVTIILGILLPFVVYVPVIPVFAYQIAIGLPGGGYGSNVQFAKTETTNPEGLLVWYTFENDFPRSHMVYDNSWNGNNAVVQGLWLTPGTAVEGNQSLDLTGPGVLAAAGNPASGKQNVSFSIWFRITDTKNNFVLASAAETGNPRTGWSISTRTHELLDDDGKPVHTMGFERYTLAYGTWVHKVIVYNGTRVRLYIDGKERGDWPATGKPLGAGAAMTLGSWQPFGRNFAGQIDDFRIYDRALSADEVSELYRTASRR